MAFFLLLVLLLPTNFKVVKLANPQNATLPKRSLYGETCQSTLECAHSSFNCSENICKCKDGRTYLPLFSSCLKTLKSLTYGNSCTSFFECGKGLNCIEQHCICLPSKTWDGHSCQNKVKNKTTALNGPCSFLSDCGNGLICIFNRCICADNQIWNGHACESFSISLPEGLLKPLQYNYPCSSQHDCGNELKCLNNRCTCSPGTKWIGTFCLIDLDSISRAIFPKTCSSHADCGKDLYCQDQHCCSLEEKWNGISCESTNKGPNEVCFGSSYCASNLICEIGTCRCPKHHIWDGRSCTMNPIRQMKWLFVLAVMPLALLFYCCKAISKAKAKRRGQAFTGPAMFIPEPSNGLPSRQPLSEHSFPNSGKPSSQGNIPPEPTPHQDVPPPYSNSETTVAEKGNMNNEGANFPLIPPPSYEESLNSSTVRS